MKTLLYFEEYENNLSRKLFSRDDINFIILRTTNNMRFFSKEYLEETRRYKTYISDYNACLGDEVRKFKEWCQQNNITIDYFLNDSEFYLEYSNNFARLLGLESLSEEQIKWVRDKVDMKKKFREIGLDTVDFSPVESKADVLQCFLSNGMKEIIFKPRREMNSIGVHRITSVDDIKELNVEFMPNQYMVESFCYDHEWSIESIVQDGIVLDSYVTYIPNATIWATMSNSLNCHMTVPKVPEFFKFVPKEFIQKIVSGMNLKNGAMTIEVFIDKDGNVKASELGWRLPGCQATLNHGLSYGIDIYNLLLDIAIHKPVFLNYRERIMSCGDLYLPNKGGVVTDVTPIEELLNMEGVIDGKLFAKVGEYRKKRRTGDDASGWVLVIGKDERETLERMQRIYENFKIESIDRGVNEKDVKEI